MYPFRHPRPARQAHAITSACAILLVSLASHAEDRAAAQRLFDQGRELMAAGKIAEACAKFDGAKELSQTPGVRLNLASCWAKLGRTASAWSMYDEALALAERAGDQAAAALARQGRADMTPRLGFLVVNVPEAAAAASGLEITRDQERLPKAAWGTSIPVNPGDHVVSAHAPGYRDWSTTRTAGGEGTTTTVDVPVLVREQSGADERVGDGRARGLGTQRVIALVSGGLGIVGVAVGTYFGLAAMSQKSDYRAHVGADGQCADTTCESSSHDAFSSGTSSTIAFIAGGVLLATGAVLWLTAPKSGSIRVAPVAASRTAGLALEGGF